MRRVILFILIAVFLSAIFLAFILSKQNNSEEISLETKIGQMIVIGYSENEEILNGIYNDIENNKVSGIIFYKKSIKSPQKIRKKN